MTVGLMAFAVSDTGLPCNATSRTAPKGSDERTTQYEAGDTTEIHEQRS